MQITDLAGLSKPLERLIEVISSGIGNVSRPYLIRKTAEAKAYEINVITDAMAESQKLLTQAEYEDGKVKVLAPEALAINTPSLPSRTTARLQYQEQREQQNVEAICANAAAELAQETDVPDAKPEPEWISRFIDISAGISTEELQNLWGRILAGEIKCPGSFSLRTLDVLRNLSRKEAENFVKLGNYILRSGDKAFFLDPKDYIFTKEGGLTFIDLLSLKDAGLVFTNDLEFSFNPVSAGETSNLIYGPLILLIEREKDTPKLGSAVGLLTRVGIELLQLLRVEPDMEYVSLIRKRFSADGVKLAWSPILQSIGDRIHFGTKTYVEPPET